MSRDLLLKMAYTNVRTLLVPSESRWHDQYWYPRISLLQSLDDTVTPMTWTTTDSSLIWDTKYTFFFFHIHAFDNGSPVVVSNLTTVLKTSDPTLFRSFGLDGWKYTSFCIIFSKTHSPLDSSTCTSTPKNTSVKINGSKLGMLQTQC